MTKPADGGFSSEGFKVKKIKSSVGKDFIRKHHYTRSCHNGPMCYGLFREDDLIGVIAFATPISENVRASVYGPDRKNEVTELHRLIILDGTKTNAESWFIAKALKLLKKDRPNYSAVVSFADETQGHVGTVYKATNALYQGTTAKAWFFRDQENRLRHPRQSGHNVTREEAEEWGWTRERREAKHRYLFLIGSSAQKKKNKSALTKPIKKYPSISE